jgi:hypothetical protein
VSSAVRVRMVKLVGALVLLALVLLQACTGVAGSGDSSMCRTEVFFGLNKKNGDTVAASEWQAFVDTCITPAFSSGFTIVDGSGQWRNESGRIEKERAKILLLLHPADDASNELVEYVRNIYKAAFQQESVLRVTMPVRASF